MTVAILRAKLTADTSQFLGSLRRAQRGLSGVGKGFQLLSIAASPLKAVGGLVRNLAGGLVRIGQIAAGILLAEVFRKGAEAIQWFMRTALQATETMQRLGIQIQTLTAREMQKNINTAIDQAVSWRVLGREGELLTFDVEKLTTALGDNAAQILKLNPELKVLMGTERRFITVTSDVNKKWISTSDVFNKAAEDSRLMINELKRIAIISPFTVATVNTMFRLGSAMGFTAKEAKTVTKGMLDVAAGLGLTEDQARRLMLNFSQIRSQSKLTQRDIREMSLTGFQMAEVFEEMNRTLGLNIKTNLDFNDALRSSKFTWEEFVESFASMADREFGESARRMAFTIGGLKSTFKDVFLVTIPTILIPAAEIFGKFAEDAVGNLLEVVESGKLEEIGRDIADRVGEGLGTVKSVFDAAGWLEFAINDLDMDFGEGIRFIDRLPRFEGLDLPDLYEDFDKLDEALDVAEDIKQAFEDAKNHVLVIGQVMSEIPVFQDISQRVETAKEEAPSDLKKFGEGILESLPNITAGLATLATVISSALLSAFDTIAPFLEDFFDVLSEVDIVPLLALGGALLALAGGITVGIITGGLRMATAFVDGLNKVWTGVKAIIEGIGQLFSGDAGGFDTMLEGFTEIGAGLMTALSGGLLGFVTGAVEGFLTFFAGILEGIGAEVPEWLQAGIDLASSFWDGFLEMIEETITDGPAKIAEIAVGIGEHIDEFRDVGVDLVQGLWDGMSSRWTELGTWINDQIAKIPLAIRIFLGIESPSKVMRTIGQQLMEGFAVGIGEGTKGATDAMVKSGGALLDAMKQSTSGARMGAEYATSQISMAATDAAKAAVRISSGATQEIASMLTTQTSSSASAMLMSEAQTRAAFTAKLDEVIYVLMSQGNATTRAAAIAEAIQLADFKN